MPGSPNYIRITASFEKTKQNWKGKRQKTPKKLRLERETKFEQKKRRESKEMEEDNGSSSSNLETSKADKAVWLMKCPVVVAKSWKSHTSLSSSDSAPLAKVVLSLDPLQSDDPSALQVFSICTQCLILLNIILNVLPD